MRLLGAAAVLGVGVAVLATPDSIITDEPQVKQRSTLQNLMSQAQVESLTERYKASLAKGEQVDPAALAAAIKSTALQPVAKPDITSTFQTDDAIVVMWNKRRAAQGFTLYRSLNGEIWEEIAQLDAGIRYYCDHDIHGGRTYRYALVATTEQEGCRNSANSDIIKRVFLSAPKVSVAKRKSKAQITWRQAKKATSYTVQYADNMFFVGAKSATASAGGDTGLALSGLSKNAPCYVRVRAERDSNGHITRSGWSYSQNVTASKTAELSTIKTTEKVKAKGKKKAKKKKVVFELRRAAKQKVLGYDTLQGSCRGGAYGYYALYNRTVNKNKIVKVKLDGMKVVKVSKALKVFHANDMTYNSKTKKLVVVHSTGDERGLSVVNTSNLKVSKRVSLKKSVARLFGAQEAEIKKIGGITSIAYNAKRNCYVATVRATHDMIELDAELKATRVIAPERKSDGVYQNMEAGNDVIIVSTSASDEQGGNYLWCYDWSGRFLCKINLPHANELEGVFLKGGKLYAGFYVSGQKTKVRRGVTTTLITRDNYCFKVKGI